MDALKGLGMDLEESENLVSLLTKSKTVSVTKND